MYTCMYIALEDAEAELLPGKAQAHCEYIYIYKICMYTCMYGHIYIALEDAEAKLLPGKAHAHCEYVHNSCVCV